MGRCECGTNNRTSSFRPDVRSIYGCLVQLPVYIHVGKKEPLVLLQYKYPTQFYIVISLGNKKEAFVEQSEAQCKCCSASHHGQAELLSETYVELVDIPRQ